MSATFGGNGGGGGLSPTVTVTNFPTLTAIAGTVTIANPGTTSGTVSVNNFPGTQAVSGTVTVANPTSSTVTVSNFPGTQAVSGTVTVANQPALVAGSASIGNVGIIGTSTISGAVSVSNFPGTQAVSGTVTVANAGTTTGTVTVSNFPTIQAVSGTVTVANAGTTSSTVTVSNFPTIQAVSGTVTVANAGTTSSNVTVSNFPTIQAVSGTVGLGVSLPAGTNTIGNLGTVATVSSVTSANVGGFTAAVLVTPTVSTTSNAYAQNYVIGGLLTFAGLVRSSQVSTILQKIVVTTNDVQSMTLDAIIFNANPTSSTVTNAAALSVAGADVAKVVGVIHISDTSSLGTPTVCQALQLGLPCVVPSAGGSLYVALVTRGATALTLGSTSDVNVLITALQD